MPVQGRHYMTSATNQLAVGFRTQFIRLNGDDLFLLCIQRIRVTFECQPS